jgi:DNA-binding FadR family transcriptional regulator
MKLRSSEIGSIQHLPSRVAAFITQQIAAGRFLPGKKLPTEHQLAQRLGVSRNVVREAISQLRADGVVQARQGVGAFVLSPEWRTAIRIDPSDLQNASGMEQLFELRCVLETQAAGLAAERRNESDLEKIRESLDRMSGEERWEEGSIDADLAFHRQIASATKNDFIHTFICFICEQIRQSIYHARLINSLPSLVETNLAEHERIYDALAAGHAKKAREAMRTHITGAAQRIGIPLSGDQVSISQRSDSG